MRNFAMHLNQEDEFVERPIYGNCVEKAPLVTIRKMLWENPSFIDEFLARTKPLWFTK
jgi:hypothetical protein